MKDLIKQWFELGVKLRFLKTIDRQCDKYNRLKKKSDHERRVANALIKEYSEIYGENLRGEQ